MSSERADPSYTFLRDTQMLCVIGLGNPGARYAGTRHNIGFQILDRFADKMQVREFLFNGNYYYAHTRYKNREILLCKPWTYMNLSGNAVALVLKESELTPSDLFVICDDIALPLGLLRIRAKGSSGGQNGLESIIQIIGTDSFPRLRCGIGSVPEGIDPADYVLSRFLKEEEASVEAMILRACDAILHLVDHGIDRTINLFNTPVNNKQENI